MKVLHFYKTAMPDSMGGVEQVIHQLSRGTSRLGVHNTVLSLSPDPVPAVVQRDGYALHRARLDATVASTGLSMAVFTQFAELAREADLVHYHFPWPFMDLVHFVSRIRKPTLLTYHSDIVRQKVLARLYQPLMRRFLGAMDCIAATSPNYLVASEVLTRYQHKVRVIPIGIDKDTYPQPSPQKVASWRAQLGERFFLFIGVLRYYKGLHILLEAAQGTNYPIVILGAGPTEQALRAHAHRLGLRNVHFLGYLPDEDKVAILELCYAVLFPSHLRSEAFGVSLLEGAMFAKPLISTEIGTGTSFVNVGSLTGLVVPSGDPAALRAAMDRLWQDPALAADMGRQAQARYWQHFTAEQMSRSYFSLYQALVSVG